MSDPMLDAGTAVGDDYFLQSRRPLASLMFSLPFLALYEIGVALQGQQAILNGADVWLRQWLEAAGVASSLALPALIVVVLLAWHHTTGQPWRVRGGVLGGMCIECGVLAVVLLACAQLQGKLFQAVDLPVNQVAAGDGFPTGSQAGQPHADDSGGTIARLVSYFGAGVYEETLFRLLLLPACVLLLRAAGCKPAASAAVAVAITSVLFAAAHHVGASGEPVRIFPLTFRIAAGAFFSVLFLFRGFGIAVGTHASYDIIVGLRLEA